MPRPTRTPAKTPSGPNGKARVVSGRGVEVVVGDPCKGAPTLHVELTRKNPRFIFDGIWKGRDVINLSNTVRRAYLVRNLEIRRASRQPSENTLPDSATQEDATQSA